MSNRVIQSAAQAIHGYREDPEKLGLIREKVGQFCDHIRENKVPWPAEIDLVEGPGGGGSGPGKAGNNLPAMYTLLVLCHDADPAYGQDLILDEAFTRRHPGSEHLNRIMLSTNRYLLTVLVKRALEKVLGDLERGGRERWSEAMTKTKIRIRLDMPPRDFERSIQEGKILLEQINRQTWKVRLDTLDARSRLRFEQGA